MRSKLVITTAAAAALFLCFWWWWPIGNTPFSRVGTEGSIVQHEPFVSVGVEG